MARPRYRNAQSWRIMAEMGDAFEAAVKDPDVRMIIVRGSGGHFSSGHDMSTPDQVADRAASDIPRGAR